ncbi:MAG: hypothetical protein ACK2UW_15200 [Anaerolineales bacterium]|jgi:hypothetical protein
MTINQDVLLVLCLTLVGVLIVNGVIIFWVRRSKPPIEFQIFSQLSRTAKNPFEKSDAQFKELSSLIDELQQQENQKSTGGQGEQ